MLDFMKSMGLIKNPIKNPKKNPQKRDFFSKKNLAKINKWWFDG